MHKQFHNDYVIDHNDPSEFEMIDGDSCLALLYHGNPSYPSQEIRPYDQGLSTIGFP